MRNWAEVSCAGCDDRTGLVDRIASDLVTGQAIVAFPPPGDTADRQRVRRTGSVSDCARDGIANTVPIAPINVVELFENTVSPSINYIPFPYTPGNLPRRGMCRRLPSVRV
uniref:Uncharacterized protein n=1 Tax=Spongospora subterranea TaxID=70186 RepID=A0A0H5RVW4_9EUKA|eukprot:CRZ12889.1 hypothetical protein [Spongospora subterranea]